MLDIKFLRENPELVKENIKKKFQDEKLSLVDEVISLDVEARKVQMEADELRSKKNQVSKQIGALMAKGEKEEAEKIKEEVAAFSRRLSELEEKEPVLQEEILKRMMIIPNMIDPSVPIGKDDSCMSVSESLLFRIIRFPIMRTSWKASAVWIWMRQGVLPEMASIIFWETWQDFIPQCFPMPEIL